jgi:hypothetical protein
MHTKKFDKIVQLHFYKSTVTGRIRDRAARVRLVRPHSLRHQRTAVDGYTSTRILFLPVTKCWHHFGYARGASS